MIRGRFSEGQEGQGDGSVSVLPLHNSTVEGQGTVLVSEGGGQGDGSQRSGERF